MEGNEWTNRSAELLAKVDVLMEAHLLAKAQALAEAKEGRRARNADFMVAIVLFLLICVPLSLICAGHWYQSIQRGELDRVFAIIKHGPGVWECILMAVVTFVVTVEMAHFMPIMMARK
jgi:hypothetical protein